MPDLTDKWLSIKTAFLRRACGDYLLSMMGRATHPNRRAIPVRRHYCAWAGLVKT